MGSLFFEYGIEKGGREIEFENIRKAIMRKKIITAVLLIAMNSVIFTGCGSNSAASNDEAEAATVTEATQEASAVEAAASVADIYKEIESTVDLISPVEMTDEYLENYYGVDLATLDEYACYMSEDAASAEAVLIIKVKDEADAATIADTLSVIRDEKATEMENYIPEQYDIVEKSSVETKGCYVWLVMSENQDAILKVINNYI